MTDDSNTLAIEGVRFFGEMSASISHEMKNALAIINENAGLLTDMVGLSEQGMPISMERLVGLAQSISRQVKRGDLIVKRFNRFAHSADHPGEIVDVAETLGFVIDLAARLIAMRGSKLQIEAPPEPVRLKTNRFFLENLMWNCLDRIMDAGAPAQGQPARIIIEAENTGARIRFCGPAQTVISGATDFPSDRDLAICRSLGARLTVDNENQQITLILP